jgi:hypothetical protein
VIQDVDDTLKQLLVTQVPIDTGEIDIRFEMPTHEWSGKLGAKPTINLYLYDIRENLELRSLDRPFTRVTTTTPPSGAQKRAPVRIDLSYLISAWTVEIDTEHNLLGRILTALLRFPLLPTEVLQGAMQSQPLPVQAWIARPERVPNPWDFWGHVENRMKSALSYVVTVAFDPFVPENVLFGRPVVNVEQLPPKDLIR